MADAIKHKERLHQLDFIVAFLKEKIKNRVFLKFDSIYAEYFQNIKITLEDPEDYWNLCMEWITMESYFMMSLHSGCLKLVLINLDVRWLYIIS